MRAAPGNYIMKMYLYDYLQHMTDSIWLKYRRANETCRNEPKAAANARAPARGCRDVRTRRARLEFQRRGYGPHGSHPSPSPRDRYFHARHRTPSRGNPSADAEGARALPPANRG